MERQLGRDQTNQVQYSVISLQSSGDTVTGRVEFRNVNITGAGLERLIEKVTATWKGDKLSRLVHELDLSDSQSASYANVRRVTGIASSFGDAFNLGNVAGAMAFLTEDAVFEGYGLCAPAPCAGKAAIQKELERRLADKTQASTIPGSDRVTGDTYTRRSEVRSDSIKAAGAERIIVASTTETKGGKVSLIRWVIDSTDPQTAIYLKVAILRQHYDAVNKRDEQGVLALFTDDASLGRGGCPPQAPCVGKAAIGRQLARDKTNQVQYSVITLQVSGDTVTGRAEYRTVNVKNADLERVIENFTATFKGDKLSRLVHELDLSDSQSAAYANFRRVDGIVTSYSIPRGLGNVAGAMAALTDDPVFEGYGLCAAAPCAGKAAIQKEVERLVADNTKSDPDGGGARVTGNILTTRREVRSDSIKAAGVERIIVALTVETKGGKVSLYLWAPDSTDPQTATYLKSLIK
jgi:ketosteroid isomerase-like protein